MKRYFLSAIQKLAKAIISKHKPYVVGITGTVGKTTTTHFTYEFLHALYGADVYVSPYHYNGEYGVPMTIFMTKSPGSNPFAWIRVFCRAFYVLYIEKNYPKYLVLEYGIDHVGEMDFMLEIAQPDVAMILNISRNHAMQFPDFQDYIDEKLKIASKAKKIIVNIDDTNIAKFAKTCSNPKVTYAIQHPADITASNLKAGIEKLEFTLSSKTESIDLAYNVIGEFQAYNILPIFGLASILGIDNEEAKNILSNIYPPSGRGVTLRGVKDAIIIDGSYNGGFSSITGGVEYMKNISGEYNKILFIGDMRELGAETKRMHIELSEVLLDSGADQIVLVGDEMKKHVFPALQEKFGEHCFHSVSSKIAGQKVREYIQSSEKQSIVFVKGSQNTIFLEEGIKAFLFDLRDQDKLCRQSSEWMMKKKQFFETVI